MAQKEFGSRLDIDGMTSDQLNWLMICRIVHFEKQSGKTVEVGETEFDRKLKEAQERSESKKINKKTLAEEQNKWIQELKKNKHG